MKRLVGSTQVKQKQEPEDAENDNDVLGESFFELMIETDPLAPIKKNQS